MDYDSYTGQESTESLEQKQEQVANEAQQEANDFVSLSQHPGWKRIVGIIQEDLNKDLQALLHSTHADTIRLFQERAKARRDFLTWLEIKVAERDYLVLEQKAAG